jgi:hypothetical protein
VPGALTASSTAQRPIELLQDADRQTDVLSEVFGGCWRVVDRTGFELQDDGERGAFTNGALQSKSSAERLDTIDESDQARAMFKRRPTDTVVRDARSNLRVVCQEDRTAVFESRVDPWVGPRPRSRWRSEARSLVKRRGTTNVRW